MPEESLTVLHAACERCRRRKQKCDQQRPTCQKCLDSHSSCIYPVRHEKRGPRPGKVAQLEARLFEVEQLIQAQNAADPHSSVEVESCLQEPSPGPSVHEFGCCIEGVGKETKASMFTGLDATYIIRRVLALTKTDFPSANQMLFPLHFGQIREDIVKGIAPEPIVVAFSSLIFSALSNEPEDLAIADELFDRATQFVNAGEGMGVTLACTTLLVMGSRHRVLLPTMWMYQGLATRACLSANLYRMDSGVSPCFMAGGPGCGKMAQCQTESGREGLRRMFWTVYFLDIVGSLVSGRPRVVDDRDLEIRLPGDDAAWKEGREPDYEAPYLDADEIEAVHQADLAGETISHPPSMLIGPALLPLFPSTGATFAKTSRLGMGPSGVPESRFSALIRLAHIGGRIATYARRIRAMMRITPPGSPLSEFALLDASLRRWLHSLPTDFFPLDQSQPDLNTVHTLGFLHILTLVLHKTRLQKLRHDPLVASTVDTLHSLMVVRHSANALSALLPPLDTTYDYYGPYQMPGSLPPTLPPPFVSLMGYMAALVHADTITAAPSLYILQLSAKEREATLREYVRCRRTIEYSAQASPISRSHLELLYGMESEKPPFHSLPPLAMAVPILPIEMDGRTVRYLNEAHGCELWKEGQRSLCDLSSDLYTLQLFMEMPMFMP